MAYNFLLQDQKPRDRKGCKDATEKLEKESGPENFDKLSVTESKTTSMSGAGKENFVVEDSQTSVYCLEAEVKCFYECKFSKCSHMI